MERKELKLNQKSICKIEIQAKKVFHFYTNKLSKKKVEFFSNIRLGCFQQIYIFELWSSGIYFIIRWIFYVLPWLIKYYIYHHHICLHYSFNYVLNNILSSWFRWSLTIHLYQQTHTYTHTKDTIIYHLYTFASLKASHYIDY